MPISHVGNWTRHKNFSVEKWRGEKEGERREKEVKETVRGGEDEGIKRANRAGEWYDLAGRRSWKRGVGMTRRRRPSSAKWEREKKAKENMNAGDRGESSLTKTFHIFIFWGKARRERGLWCYYSVCYCGKCYYYGVYGAEGESFPQKEHVCVKTLANIICHLLSTRGTVPLNGLKRPSLSNEKIFLSTSLRV